MSSIKSLPLFEGTNFIIVDEDLEASFAEILITGWLKMWEKERPNFKTDIISFSNPRYIYINHFSSLELNNASVTDFYSLDPNEVNSLTEKLDIYLNNLERNSIIVVDCLSTLSLTVGLEKAMWFIEKLKQKSEKLIAISRRDFGKINVPNVETMGNTYIKLKEHLKTTQTKDFVYEGTYAHRKLGGSILRQTEIITQDVNTYEIRSTKVLNNSTGKLRSSGQESNKEIKASFRIETNDHEMTQKLNTPLPYIVANNQNKQTTIFYEPEDYEDDEDPDDDLEI